VKDLSDAVMVKMMADENRMQWGNSPAATNEAIEGAQLILEEAIADSDTLADFRGFAGELAKLSKGWKPSDWSRIKNSGEAGVKMIHDFLGESWATGVIQSSLNVINADRIATKNAVPEPSQYPFIPRYPTAADDVGQGVGSVAHLRHYYLLGFPHANRYLPCLPPGV
jgi:hypothetical protein